MRDVQCKHCIEYKGDWCDKKHDDPDPDLERDCEHYRINTTAVTICNNCLRLKQGLCDGEKELTACPSYKRMTNGDRIRAMTDEELAKMLSTSYPCDTCAFSPPSSGDGKPCCVCDPDDPLLNCYQRRADNGK